MVVPLLLFLHARLRATSLEAAVARLPGFVWAVVVALMFVAIILTSEEDRAFIYFQF